jgi:hypothetical protein
MIALTRHFYIIASRFTTQIAAEPFPNWHTAKTSNVRAHIFVSSFVAVDSVFLNFTHLRRSLKRCDS